MEEKGGVVASIQDIFKIRQRCLALWSFLKNYWPWDRSYFNPTEEQQDMVRDIVREAIIILPLPNGQEIRVRFGSLVNKGDYWDCDNFACGRDFLGKLLYMQAAEVSADKQEEMLPEPLRGVPKLPPSEGQARGTKFRGMPIRHALNFTITPDKVRFEDHDDGGRIWEAKTENDTVFYLSL